MRVLTMAFAIFSFGVFAPVVSAAEETASEPELNWFAVEIMTGPNWDPSISASEQPFFREHSTHLQKLRTDGHIVMGARYSDIGLLVFQTGSIDEINKLLVADPSIQAGTFTYDIHAMNVFFPGSVGNSK
jgi:hypothetical protein